MTKGRLADLAMLVEAVQRVWSRRTASTYTEADPARGQCSVTALAIQYHLGGDILKTPTPGGSHFYNRVDGRRVDLTAAQFPTAIDYADLPSGPDEAMTDTSPDQLAALLDAIRTGEGGPTVGRSSRPTRSPAPATLDHPLYTVDRAPV